MSEALLCQLDGARAEKRHLLLELESRGRRIRELERELEAARRQMANLYAERLRLVQEAEALR